jgi:cysteine desulfurase
MSRIYFDNAATTPVDASVVKAMEPYFQAAFGNASSPHRLGQDAAKALDDARQRIAEAIGAKPSEIIFNSGATEANNHAVFGTARAQREKGKHIIISSVEHHSVIEPAQCLGRDGHRISYVGVDKDGMIDPQQIKEAITRDTVLIALIHASNEIGTIQPVKRVGEIAKAAGVTFLVDATQTIGHQPVNVNDLNADLMSFSAHKFYGPKGMGALYVREGTPLSAFLLGGDQERSRRASTQNVAGAVGMAQALKICLEGMGEEQARLSRMRDKLLKRVPQLIDGVKVNGHARERLANNAHFSFEGIDGEALLMSLDMAGIASSMGSACTSGAMEASHVLRAIGLPDELAFGSLRISLGRFNKESDVDYLLEKLPDIVKSLRI